MHNRFTFNTVESEQQQVTPISSPSVNLDQKLKDKLVSQIQEENVVMVHCTFNSVMDGGIRIWNSTFLIDHISSTRCKMLHAQNITTAPAWTIVPAGTTFRFTLIFESLPKSCEVFDLLEDIPETDGFFIQNIRRNKSDVYHVKIF